MKNLITIAIALAICATTAFAQPASPTITLGDSMAQVRAKLGVPILHKDGQESYLRKAYGTRFILTLMYWADDSISRLEPTMRVHTVLYSPDQHKPWRELASEIPEIRKLCSKGCDAVQAFAKDGARIDSFDTFVMACGARDGLIDSSQTWWQERTKPELCFTVSFAGLPDESFENEIDLENTDVDHIDLHIDTPSLPTMKGFGHYVSIRRLSPLTF